MDDSELRKIIEDTEREKNKLFLKSWKVAVNKIGTNLFKVKSTSVETATDRKELLPDMEAIKQYLNKKYDPHYFLFMVVSFYSFVEIEEIYTSLGFGYPRVIDLQLLDDTERMIIYSLVEYSDVDDEW